MANQTNNPQPQADPGVDDALAAAQASLDAMQDAVGEGGDGFTASDPASATAGGAPAGAPGDAADAEGSGGSGIELLGDVDLQVMIELGRTEMLVEDVLRLGGGSVVELDKLAGDPVDVYVNNRLVARGEVLVLNDNFCIRISEIVANLEEQVEAAAEEQNTQ